MHLDRDPLSFQERVQAYQGLLEDMPVMLWTARPDGTWTHVNSRWVDYTGVVGQTPGFGFEVAVHPDDLPQTLDAWRSAIQRGSAYEIEYRIRRHDGVYRWFVIRGSRVADPAGQAQAWVGTCTDIEVQKQAELAASAAREAAVRALGLAMEARDRETQGHTDRVTAHAVQLGQALGLPLQQITALRLGAYLHDIGKLKVPDRVLLKPGPLDGSERSEMCTHVLSGVQFARELQFLPPDTLELIADHHERWDGSGYPRGRSGTEISLLGRIFAVVDVYDALISTRPYKAAWSSEEACAELRAQAGRHFDPAVVQAFLTLFGEERR